MGNGPSHAVAVEIHRKDFGEVDRDLINDLQENARRTAASDFGLHLGGGLDEILHHIGMVVFGNAFGYKFCDGQWCSPPNATGRTKTVTRLCNIYTPVGRQVADHLRDGVFSALDLPKWMESNAIADVCNFTDDFVRSDTMRQWKYTHYTRTYDAREEDQDSCKCDSCFVYVNGSLVEDGVEAGRCIVFYMGAYYPVHSETKIIRDDMQRDAYRSAAAQAVGYHDTPSNDAALKQLLNHQCGAKFSEMFGYEYTDNPPLSCRADGIDAAIVERNSQLGYFQDLDIGDGLASNLDHQLFQGLNIGLPSIRKRAIDNTAAEYRDVLQGTSGRTWNTKYIDKCYTPADPSLHPIHENGIMMWFHLRQTTQHGANIWVTYIYTKTVFYETLPAEQEAIKSLFRLLCKNLLVRLKHPTLDAPIADPEHLKNMLFEFAKEKFQDAFGFDYAGERTRPPNKKDSGKMRTFAELLTTTTVPVSVPEIESWIDNEIFTKKSMLFPAYAVGDIYRDLRDKVAELCSSDTKKDPDFWYSVPTLNVYQKPDSIMGIKHHGLFLYALGDATIEGVQVQRMFVYYLGVLYGVELE